MLKDYRGANALVLAVPAGGIPVAAAMAAVLEFSARCHYAYGDQVGSPT